MRTIPAAAVVKDDLVRVDGMEVRVVRVHNSEPFPGRITWDTDVEPVEIGAATRVEILSLP